MEDEKIRDRQREEWSRHYDNIQWKVISIFTAGTGVLVLYSIKNKSSSPLIEICGLALIIVGVLYVASFRSFRNHLHSEIINKDLQNFLEGRSPTGLPRQWTVFVLSFFAASCLFSYHLAEKICGFWVTFVCFVMISALLLYLVWRAGVSDKKQNERLSPRAETPMNSNVRQKVRSRGHKLKIKLR